jgi:hypothetical protein
MEHVAIMRKSWGLTQKILGGQKTIESRWYMSRVAPWDRIKPGETVYFKDSGEPVTIKAEVKRVVQMADLTPERVGQILDEHGKADGITPSDIIKFYGLFKHKKYCILIFLRNPQKVKPFGIDKTGFGAMSAWLCVDNVEKIRTRRESNPRPTPLTTGAETTVPPV